MSAWGGWCPTHRGDPDVCRCADGRRFARCHQLASRQCRDEGYLVPRGVFAFASTLVLLRVVTGASEGVALLGAAAVELAAIAWNWRVTAVRALELYWGARGGSR